MFIFSRSRFCFCLYLGFAQVGLRFSALRLCCGFVQMSDRARHSWEEGAPVGKRQRHSWESDSGDSNYGDDLEGLNDSDTDSDELSDPQQFIEHMLDLYMTRCITA